VAFEAWLMEYVRGFTKEALRRVTSEEPQPPA
ncbi:MAG: hypothetical protein JWP46_2284, partial [Modestobacter sp.]|nr:hypothetical protein [Modestobacter sp.]